MEVTVEESHQKLRVADLIVGHIVSVSFLSILNIN
jgi:hypothetical protein